MSEPIKKTVKEWAIERDRANGVSEEETELRKQRADFKMPGGGDGLMTEEEFNEAQQAAAILALLESFAPEQYRQLESRIKSLN